VGLIFLIEPGTLDPPAERVHAGDLTAERAVVRATALPRRPATCRPAAVFSARLRGAR